MNRYLFPVKASDRLNILSEKLDIIQWLASMTGKFITQLMLLKN
jgi:hypothetical protein